MNRSITPAGFAWSARPTEPTEPAGTTALPSRERPTRRVVLRGIAAAIAGGTSAGCASRGASSGQRRTAGGEAPQPTPALPPATLELWLPGRQADADALVPFHREFMAEAPAVRDVRIQLTTNETMMDQLTAALAGGTPPDLARLKEYRLADLGARGALTPLDARVAADPNVRLADFTPQSVEGSRVRTGPAAPPAAARATPGRSSAGDGRPLLGLPDSHQMVVLFWNKDLVARAGLDPDRPPGGWDALRRAAAAIAEAAEEPAAGTAAGARDPGDGSAAKPWGIQFYEFSTREQTYCWFMEWVWRAGGEVWSDVASGGAGGGASGLPRVTLDTPAAQQALQFQVDLLHADRTAVPAGTPVPELIANVPQGRVGYWMTTANAALTYDRTAPGLRVAVGPLPPGKRDAHQLQHNALSLFRDSRAPDAAYQLLSFRSREDIQARWSAEGAWLPVRPALWDRAPFNQDPHWRDLGALVRRQGNRTKPVVPEWDAFTAVLLPPLLAAWRGELAPRQALQEAERAGNAHLAAR